MGESLGLPRARPKAVQGIDLAQNQHGGIGWDSLMKTAPCRAAWRGVLAGSGQQVALSPSECCWQRWGQGQCHSLGRWHRASGSAGC